MNDVQRILRQKALAFFLVAASALGSVLKEQAGMGGGVLLDGLLMACLAVGLLLWVQSKRRERRIRREGEEGRE
jgi:hypothetical protein